MNNNQYIMSLLQESIVNLTRAQSKVADYIYHNYKEVSFMTIEQLAAKTNTSTATIMRLANNMGYSGYSEMIRDLQKQFLNHKDPFSKFVDNLDDDNKKENIIMRCAQNHINNIQQTVELFSEKQLQEAVSLILNARNIYFIGFRSSFPIAAYLYHDLNRLLSNCYLVSLGIGDFPEILNKMSKDDLIIAVSFPRHVSNAPDMIRLAKQSKEVKVITITGNYSKSIAKYSDLMISCAYKSASFHNSMSGALFVADCLISALAVYDTDKTEQCLKNAEESLLSWAAIVHSPLIPHKNKL